MEIGNLIRYWRRAGLYAVVAIALPAMGIGASTTSATPAQTPSSKSNASHSASSHATTSHASSSSTKSHATTAKTGSGHTTAKRTTSHSGAHSKKGTKSSKKRGQQVIDTTRAREIQEALIREHYLNGEPSGTWDSTTQEAMQRYQNAQGWQSKTTPDSRALIKLGLGPSHDHLLNPESAMTSANPAAAVDSSPKATPKPATEPSPAPLPKDQPQH
jgi:hypothetical protein